MKNIVLIVDDNQEMLFTLKDGLEKYADAFSVMISGDGVDAFNRLQRHLISVIVTDLKMPRMDGISLLTSVTVDYPGTPVIVMTGYITNDVQEKALRSGASDYIEKPFLVDDLAAKIMAVIRQQADGGKLQQVTPSIFLQLVAAEEKTCTIRLTCCATGRSGILFFHRGDLVQARCAGATGEAAAYEILGWDMVDLAIQNRCGIHTNAINKDVHAIYLEALRRKDEDEASSIQPLDPHGAETPAVFAMRDTTAMDLRRRIESRLGKRSGLEDIYQDNSWLEPLAVMKRLGDALGAGPLKIAYIDRADPVDYILLPGDPVQVVSIDPKAPRDRLLEALMN
jgi:CheY-like chemotaxis protein